jgi:predicted HAD superfamily Cof-like phosphohydrolase
MSEDWVSDIAYLHKKFGVHKRINELDRAELYQYLQFRLNFLKEEMAELNDAFKDKNAEEVVDALIDICVVAIGTLDALEVNPYKAWDRVHESNMKKEPGVKASRPNPLGFPDLIKPEGWAGPSHEDNHGLIKLAFISDGE